ncbi:MAG: hypothetical protein WBX15_17775 [Thermoanaerobaculia bacterium]
MSEVTRAEPSRIFTWVIPARGPQTYRPKSSAIAEPFGGIVICQDSDQHPDGAIVAPSVVVISRSVS